MDFLKEILPSIPSIREIIQWGGIIGIVLIVFAETGLLVGFFLPGDSLLVTAGIFAANGDLSLALLLTVVPLAAIIGDAVGYQIGKRAGAALYSRPDSRFFKKKHLHRAHDFYEKYGGKTIVLARFVPIVRTFAPTVAGAAGMSYRRFATFNVFGGILWVYSTVLLGYGLGRSVPDLEKHIHIVIAIVIVLSILPGIWEMVRGRRQSVAADAARPPRE